jgi:hypothetical protein
VARDEELSELGDDELEGNDKINDLDELEGYRDLGDADLGKDEEESEDKERAATETEESSRTEVEETDEEEEESLEALLGTDETVTEASPRVAGARAPEGIGEDEFTCRSCFLVKSRAQLADIDTLVCTDCA